MPTIDLADCGPDFTANPFPYYAKWREQAPVHEVRTPDGGRFWLVLGYDEGRAALADRRLSKNRATAGLPERFVDGHLLVVDPPDHTRLRKLVSRDFTPRRIDLLAPRLQEICDGLLDAVLPDGRADVIGQLAFPLSITLLCELLGVPAQDHEVFRTWVVDMLAPSGPGVALEASQAVFAFLGDLIEEKRHTPPTDDLLSALLGTHAADSDRLSVPEVRSMAFLLLLAGHETSTNLISNGVRNLLGHPEQLALLRSDMSLLDSAIEEVLRFDGSVETSTKRFTFEPVEYGGVLVPAGETVVVSLLAANRDPARFALPDSFDITRAQPRGAERHLAFGHGIHFCLGAPLARVEARVAIGTLLERCPDLRLDTDEELQWLPGLVMRGTRHLPVRW